MRPFALLVALVLAPLLLVLGGAYALSAAGGGGAGGNKVQLAQELTAAADEGRLTGILPDHIKEIRWIAQGQAVPNCDVDVRILQVLVLALRKFESVGISDINRHCTGQASVGAGLTSSHWTGRAVDIISLSGRVLDGADGQSIRLISMLDPLMPSGSRIGQSNCRGSEGTALALENFTQFSDSCDHLHVDLAFAGDKPLTF